MLRPERMSRVSVAGSKRVMDGTIEAIHDQHCLHLSGYGGSWEGFDGGRPAAGADDASEKLVTVRSLQSILGVTDDDAGPSRVVTDSAIDGELAEVRRRANELDERRSELDDEIGELDERIDAMEPFAELGIDLGLLSGYRNLSVAVGEGDPEAIERTLVDADGIGAYDVEATDSGVVAVFTRPTGDGDPLDEALVGVEFAALDVPDAEGSPGEYVAELCNRREQLVAEREAVAEEVDDLRVDAAGFLLAAEERLAIEVQRSEAPLNFATTENSFVAEGWIPSDRYTEFENAIQDRVGDRVDIEELERASYTEGGHVSDREPVGGEEDPTPDIGEPEPTAADGGRRVKRTDDGANAPDDTVDRRADGGIVTMNDAPPTVMSNPAITNPFQVLTRAVGTPNYTEFDPTVVLFLTFPAFFGFMIGDIAYGLLYGGIGLYLYRTTDTDALRELGGVAMWAGGFTILFGLLYGEVFGLHLVTTYIWDPLIGGAPMHKGLQPVHGVYARTWVLLSLVIGVAHVTLGHLLSFAKRLHHGVGEAFAEAGAWAAVVGGVWLWVFSTQAAGSKPDFMFQVFASEAQISAAAVEAAGAESAAELIAYPLGFAGFPSIVGTVGLALAGIGLVAGTVGEVREIGVAGLIVALVVEGLEVFVNVLSYARIGAVLLAKAGMAFVVNALVFGAYVHHGEYHFIFIEGGSHGHEVLFPGLVNAESAVTLVIGVIAGILLFVAGHLIVLALGVTSAGLQAVRLEYVEFFNKFYEGDGKTYEPFGYDRKHTTEESIQ